MDEHALFVESCTEHLDLAEEAVLVLEEGGPFVELMQQVYRSLHTVKGDARTVGNTHSAALAHALEDRLEALIAQGPPLRKEHASQLLAALDDLRAAIHEP